MPRMRALISLREVRDRLDRAAEEVAAALLLDDGVVDLAHGQRSWRCVRSSSMKRS